jgi:sulfur carrier protein ThiS
MIVNVRLFGDLRTYCKQVLLEKKELKFTVPENSTPKTLLELLGIPEKEEIILIINPRKKEKILSNNEIYRARKEIELKDDDIIWIYSFLEGG